MWGVKCRAQGVGSSRQRCKGALGVGFRVRGVGCRVLDLSTVVVAFEKFEHRIKRHLHVLAHVLHLEKGFDNTLFSLQKG